MTTNHPVDSTIRTCCGGIGSHTPDCNPTALSQLTDDELVAEVRRRTVAIVNQLGGLQLIRVYDAIKEIAL